MVTYCIAKDSLPLRIVEKDRFKRMLKEFDSRYQLPSRNYISRVSVPGLYMETVQRVKEKLSSASYFASTTDMWSSIVGLRPYMSYTIHFIDEEWNLQSISLGTHYLPEDHTATILGEAMESVLQEWDLKAEHQVAITTDNGANIVAAATQLSWTRVSCFGHNLHLGVTKAIDRESRCSRALGLAHKIVSSFSMSWKRRRELEKAQRSLSIHEHSLISDCKTRWGSTQKMLERLVEQEPTIRVVLASDRKVSHLIPTWQDMEVWKSINEALAPLADFTDVMSGNGALDFFFLNIYIYIYIIIIIIVFIHIGEKYVTSSAFVPILKLLSEDVLKEKEEDATLTNNLRSSILTDLLQRNLQPQVVELLQVSSFTDPRFRCKYLDDDEAENVISLVRLDCVEVLLRSSDASESSSTPSAASSSTASTLQPPAKKRRTLGSLFKSGDANKAAAVVLSPEEKANNETEKYRAEELLDPDDDPLKWWKLNGRKYPLLSEVAKKYLAIPATSSPSERLFSSAGNIVTPLRNSLDPMKVHMLTFLATNAELPK